AADPAASANIALSGNSTLSAKSLVLGQGAVTFRLRPANTATPPLAAASLTTAAPAPVLILDPAGLAPPAGVSLVIPLLQTNTPTAAPVFDFRPLNLPKTHDASLAWSADAKTLSASLVPLFNPSDLPTDALLAYALTDAYVLGPDNLPSTNGSVAHLPKTTLSGGDLSLAFTPLRPECRYEVQRSLDLQTWETVATVPPSETEVSVSVPAASPRLFLRLKITPAK
ncbi:MAG: hypothetical protein LBR12_03530, partial [Opitutaceae bacterium]|nr:hypothetical protein [Opitutaceae bacterium]